MSQFLDRSGAGSDCIDDEMKEIPSRNIQSSVVNYRAWSCQAILPLAAGFRVPSPVHRTLYSTPSTKTYRRFHLSLACHSLKVLVILASTWMSVCFFVFEAHHLRHPRLFRVESHRTNKAGAPRV